MNVKHALVQKDLSLRNTIIEMEKAVSRGGVPGIAVVIDRNKGFWGFGYGWRYKKNY